ncbi:unnamed protein product [Adineta steineri]|uniref:F-box domain-containing protein n=1 Tax=Adineta steineri TaxID=433720 RepID=A0A814AZR8_9BILA|nr:unnamed protein product [Adineta steineri]CAF0920788.1 unnamed protein product [Adineta steineri]
MVFLFESFPNEIFIHGIFSYLSLIDLNYEFLLLNQRFKWLVDRFLARKQHCIHITCDTTCHKGAFILDYILPFHSDNQHLKSFEISHAEIFIKFIDNINRIDTNHLNKIVVTPYIDIYFDSVINIVYKSPQLHEIKLNVLTNIDSSWGDGRKWTRWFEILMKQNRQNILRILDICIWCINNNDANNFDLRLWSREGVYQLNTNWKVQLKSDQYLNWTQRRRAIECSPSDQDYSVIFHDKQNPTCSIN